jgi:hypothetical protein
MISKHESTKPFKKKDDYSSSSGGGGGKNNVTSQNTDSDVISAKLNQLSLEERSDALYDLHGVADKMIHETPNYIKAKTEEMGNALLSSMATLKSEESLAFRTAFRTSKDYVERLKLRFLRSENYDSKLAATRLTHFLSRKMELFGEELLVRDIRLKDLTDKEREILQEGLIQLLPQCDRAGRAILLVDGRVNSMYPNTKSVVS